MSMPDVFAPAESRYRSELLADTWGHLAPRRNAKYKGHIRWALGLFGSERLNPTVLSYRLESKTAGELDASPWFYEAVIDFLQQQSEEAGTIWVFTGYFKNYEFVGDIRQIHIPGMEI